MKNKSNFLGSSIALLIATSCCWLPPLVAVIVGAAGLAAFSAWFDAASPWLMAGGAALFIWSVLRIWRSRRGLAPVLSSVLTCPACGYFKRETMPTDACRFFYECQNCRQLLKPKPGDCCVFCSYGTVKCPPIQLGQNCCE